MRIFITGATGFVGRNLIAGLSGEHELIASQGDIREPLESLPASADIVIHAAAAVGNAAVPAADQAASPPPRGAETAPDQPAGRRRSINVGGTHNVARAALAMRAKRFVYLSTGGVYRASSMPSNEDAEIAPKGEYAISKWEGEQVLRELNIPVQILRLFFPYGPGQRDRFIPRLVERIRNAEPITDGPRMNPMYIDDLVESIRRLLRIEDSLVVNLAGKEIASVGAIAQHIGKLAGRAPNIEHTGDPNESWIADISRAIALTGYEPRVSLEEGLARTVATIS